MDHHEGGSQAEDHVRMLTLEPGKTVNGPPPGEVGVKLPHSAYFSHTFGQRRGQSARVVVDTALPSVRTLTPETIASGQRRSRTPPVSLGSRASPVSFYAYAYDDRRGQLPLVDMDTSGDENVAEDATVAPAVIVNVATTGDMEQARWSRRTVPFSAQADCFLQSIPSIVRARREGGSGNGTNTAAERLTEEKWVGPAGGPVSSFSYMDLYDKQARQETESIYFDVVDNEVLSAVLQCVLSAQGLLPPREDTRAASFGDQPPSKCQSAPPSLPNKITGTDAAVSSLGELPSCGPDEFIASVRTGGSMNFTRVAPVSRVVPRTDLFTVSAHPNRDAAECSEQVEPIFEPGQQSSARGRRRVVEIEDLPEIPGPYDDMPIWQREVRSCFFNKTQTCSLCFAAPPIYSSSLVCYLPRPR